MLFKSLLLFITNPTKIFLNLDKFNDLLIHAGITFKNSKEKFDMIFVLSIILIHMLQMKIFVKIYSKCSLTYSKKVKI